LSTSKEALDILCRTLEMPTPYRFAEGTLRERLVLGVRHPIDKLFSKMAEVKSQLEIF
jgi:hypothetical protein